MRQQADDFGGKMEQGVPAGDILDEVLKRYESEMADAGSSLSVALYEFSAALNTPGMTIPCMSSTVSLQRCGNVYWNTG